jgi:hypothetical protein
MGSKHGNVKEESKNIGDICKVLKKTLISKFWS